MSKFTDELRILINTNSRENNSDTPDFILAEYLLHCLVAFEKGVSRREKWYGRKKGVLNNITSLSQL